MGTQSTWDSFLGILVPNSIVEMALFRQVCSRAFGGQQKLLAASSQSVSQSCNASDLRSTLAEKIPVFQEEVKAFRKQHGNTKIGEITVDMLYGGMRMKGLVTETSVLDADEGIRFRGYTIPECQELLPKAPGGKEPLPEGLFWLLVTGDIPTEEQVRGLSQDWASRAELPSHVVAMLNNFPSNLHQMAQFLPPWLPFTPSPSSPRPMLMGFTSPSTGTQPSRTQWTLSQSCQLWPPPSTAISTEMGLLPVLLMWTKTGLTILLR